MKFKKDDNIIVITGDDKGKKGKILAIFPKENRVLVDGINTVKKHQKPTKKGQKGQVIEKPMPMHASNVKLA